MKLFRKILCRLGWHHGYDVIQTFGSAQHIGCPDCGKQFAIHHGMRAFVRWDQGFAELYQHMGYDIEGPTSRWQEYRRAIADGDQDEQEGGR